MVKTKQPSYLSPKKVLTKEEFFRYKINKQDEARRKLLEKTKQLEKSNEYQISKSKYEKTRSGKFSGFLAKGIKTIGTKQGITRSLYRQPFNPNSSKFTKGNNQGRGRPTGSYDQRYAQYGGIYGFRKFQAQQFRLQRMESLRRATINPQQQIVLNQIQTRENQRRMSPENQIIPDSTGIIPLKDLFNEIDNATHAFD